MSRRAIERNRVPENVIAVLIIEPYLKHFMPEMNLPKRTTSEKKIIINDTLMMVSTNIVSLDQCKYYIIQRRMISKLLYL